jgi:hypothetical protein
MTRSFALYTGKKGVLEIDLAIREEFEILNAKYFVKSLIDSNLVTSNEGESLVKMIMSKDKDSRDMAYEILKHQYNYKTY